MYKDQWVNYGSKLEFLEEHIKKSEESLKSLNKKYD